MVTKQDLLDLYFTEGWHDNQDLFYNLQTEDSQARYFYKVSSGFFEDHMLCFLTEHGYFDHSQGHIISSKAQLKKILKLHGL